jgi:hypothetical protein
MDDIADVLGSSPEWFPYELALPADGISFVRLKKADYERASFLDARLAAAPGAKQMLSFDQIAAAIAAAPLAECRGYIFHIGHVGSTLLSRLVGAHASAFSLREPMILRTFAQLAAAPEERPREWRDDSDVRLSLCLKLLSRTFEPRQTAVVKATSFVSELSAGLVSRTSRPRAVMMYVAPESYLATILGGPNSRQEARMLAPARLARLHRRIGMAAWQLTSLSEGEMLALSWACEMSALAEGVHAGSDGALPLDFDQFLRRPAPLLRSVLRHFGIDASEEEVRAILGGPDMYRYSKAPEHAYDADLRREVLNEARAEHGAEIRRGLQWLDRAAAQFTAVREALTMAMTAGAHRL